MKKILLFSFAVLFTVSAFSQSYVQSSSIGTGAAYASGLGDPNLAVILSPTQTASVNDVLSPTQTIPFTFNFYGNSYTSYKVSDNGYITFDLTATTSTPTPTALPSISSPKNAIFAFWDSLELKANSNDIILGYTYGTAPRRVHVIEWYSVSNTNTKPYDAVNYTAGFVYASIRLYECGDFDIVLDGTSYTSIKGTIGCQNSTGTVGSMLTNSPSFGFPVPNAHGNSADDNVYSFTSSGTNYDVSLESLTTPNTAAIGPVSITGTLNNNGLSTITSIDFTYSIDGGASVNQSLTSLSIAPSGTYTFTLPTSWVATSGSHIISVTSTLVNANTDQHSCNNTVSTPILIFDPANKVPMTPLFEVFTSSTCPPCNPGNANFHSVITGKPAKDFVYVKFQQDFPGTGDPYSTDESTNRRGFYGINSIPRMELNGGWDQNASSFTQSLYTSSKAAPAFATMNGTYKVFPSSKKVEFTVNYTPVVNINANETQLYVAILEKKTVKNIKTNGETSFFQVMKKMIPSENGTTLPAITANTAQTYTDSYTFNGSYRLPTDGQTANIINHATENSVESFHSDSLMVVSWLQMGASRVVLQSVNLDNSFLGFDNLSSNGIDENSFNLFPSPANASVNINFELSKESKINVMVTDILGKVVDSENTEYSGGKHILNINTSKLNNGSYFIVLDNGTQRLTKKFVVAH